MWARPRTSIDGLGEQRQDSAHVDRGGDEQLLADAAAPELGRGLGKVGQGAASQRQPVRVDAARGDADDRVAGLDRGTGDDPVERDDPGARADEVEAPRRGVAAHELGELRELAAGNLDAGRLGAGAQPLGDRGEHLGLGCLDGDVVEQGDRLGPDADQVVRVHGDAVDPDGVVALEGLGDDDLGADAVGGEREAGGLAQCEHARVVAGGEHRARRAAGVDLGKDPDEPRDGLPGTVGVDAGAGVGALAAHRPIEAHGPGGPEPWTRSYSRGSQASARAPKATR